MLIERKISRVMCVSLRLQLSPTWTFVYLPLIPKILWEDGTPGGVQWPSVTMQILSLLSTPSL